MDRRVDPVTLGDGPFLLVSEGDHHDRRRVFVDVVRGPVDADVAGRILGARWDWSDQRRLEGLLNWHSLLPYLLWHTSGRDPGTIRLAPTTPRVAALAEELVRAGQPTGESVIAIASWTDEQADRLSVLLEQVRRRFASDLTEPPWLMSFRGAFDAEAFLRELDYELGERALPAGEESFGAGAWMVYSVGHQGDVHEVDVIWGEAHRYSIAGAIRRSWGSADELLGLRGSWWDVDEAGRITITLAEDPFEVELVKVSSSVAHALVAFQPYHCCGGGIFDIPRWSEDQARRFTSALQTLTVPATSIVGASVLNHPPELDRPDELSAAMEALAEPAERPIDTASAADLRVIWDAVGELVDGTDVMKVVMVGSCAAVQLVGEDDGSAGYGCRRAGPFRLFWYRHGRRAGSSFSLNAVDPAQVVEVVTASAGQNRPVDKVSLEAVGDEYATLSVWSWTGEHTAIGWGRIELPSGRIVQQE